MIWNFNSDKAIYSQIIDHIKLFIVSGELKAGTKLSSVRDLATEAGVNPNTMQRALSELENTGLVYSNRTSGRFITEDINIINKVKKETADKSIKLFLNSMSNIGFNKEETINLLKEYKEDVNNEWNYFTMY